MNIALLFNSDHPSLGGWYGHAILERILRTNELQKSNRNLRISLGDILTYSAASRSDRPTMDRLIELCKETYVPASMDCLVRDRLCATYGKATVYCWLIQNMTLQITKPLHKRLQRYPSYLGAMDVDFSKPFHLYFFRNMLVSRYRLNGRRCSMFYSMGENEDPDISERDVFVKYGFSVDYEDIGAQGTIFDNYDDLEHFARVEDFKRIFADIQGIGVDLSSDLALRLEDLHPRLFDAFASAARTLERAETEEDYAQVALSGRRLIESSANYLFPPQSGLVNGRKVGRAEYRNRLWAYIEMAVQNSGPVERESIMILGKEIERLIELFNSGLHAGLQEVDIEMAFRDLVFWMCNVLEISPSDARKPYLAYEAETVKFITDITGDDEP